MSLTRRNIAKSEKYAACGDGDGDGDGDGNGDSVVMVRTKRRGHRPERSEDVTSIEKRADRIQQTPDNICCW
jgi:hypothetical protein